MPRRRANRRAAPKRRLLAFTLGVVVTAVSLELGLGLAYRGFVALQQSQNRADATQGELRILCVGESTTAVAGDEEGTLLVTRTAYPAQLESALQARAPEVPWRVLNGGIMGGTSSTVLQRLETEIDQLQPHVIIAMMGIKDTPAEWTPFGVALPSWMHRLHLVRLTIWLLEDVSLESSPRPLDVHTFADLPTWAQKRFENAGNHIQELRIIEDRSALDRLKAGVYLLQLGHVDLALQKVQAIVESDGVGMVFYATVLAADGQAEAATAVLRAAMSDHPKEGLYAVALADHLRRQHKHAEALSVLDQLDANGPSPLERFYAGLVRAEVLLDSDRPRDALDALKVAAPELTPAQREVLPSPTLLATSTRGRAYVALKDWKSAQHHLREALRVDPNRQANMYMLSQVYRETGQLAAEATLRRQMVERSGRVAEHFELAKLLRLSGDEAGAQMVMQEAAAQTPSLTQNYALLYEMAHRKGIQLVVMQYPGFSLDSLERYAPAVDGVRHIDNRDVFAADPAGYFFEPTYPQSFSHYTYEGAQVLAEHVAAHVLELPVVVAREAETTR